jgi:PAS domain S-box-containing protein
MCFSWWAWRWEKQLEARAQHRELRVYAGVGAFTVLSFLFFAFVPLPAAYYPNLFFGRPEEFVAAAFFCIALYGYSRKGAWKTDAVEHWCVIPLIFAVFSQAAIMSRSFGLFDAMFDAAHAIKVVSYGCVLVGLLSNTFDLYRQAEMSSQNLARSLEAQESTFEKQADSFRQLEAAHEQIAKQEHRFRSILKNVIDAIININARGIVEDFNPAAEKMFGYSASEVLGNNVKMLMPSSWQGKHDGFLTRYQETGEKKVIGKSVEVEGRRKNGDVFPLLLSVSETVRNSGVQGVGNLFTGIMRDLSAEKRAESELVEAKDAAETA